MLCLWPSQVFAHLQQIHATEGHSSSPILHHEVDLRSLLQGTPASLIAERYITMSFKECNPDMDVLPTGLITQVTLDTDRAHSFGVNGHYAGSVTHTLPMRGTFLDTNGEHNVHGERGRPPHSPGCTLAITRALIFRCSTCPSFAQGDSPLWGKGSTAPTPHHLLAL